MHRQVDDQLAVGAAFDRGDVEFAGGKEIVVEIAALAVFVLVEVDDLVGIEGIGRQRRHEDTVVDAIGELRAVARRDPASLGVRSEDILGDIVLADRDLFHVVGDGARLEHLERHAAVQADGGNAGLHGAEIGGTVQHAGRGHKNVDVRRHHAFANRRGRVVVIRRTPLEQRHRDVGAELGQNALHHLPDACVVRRVAEHEHPVAALDIANKRPAQVIHVAGHEKRTRGHHHTSPPVAHDDPLQIPQRSPRILAVSLIIAAMKCLSNRFGKAR